MNLVFKCSLAGVMLILTGCDTETVTSAQQQQHFICKSLIQGFLRIQTLGHYQLDKDDKIAAELTQLNYIVQPEHRQYGLPQQQRLRFSCLQQHNLVQVRLIDPSHAQAQLVLSLAIPSSAHMKRLTAYTWTAR